MKQNDPLQTGLQSMAKHPANKIITCADMNLHVLDLLGIPQEINGKPVSKVIVMIDSNSIPTAQITVGLIDIEKAILQARKAAKKK